MSDPVEPRPIGRSLERVVGGLGSRSVMIDLHDRWSDVVGAAIAERCRPRRLVEGVLHVEVDHPGWATEIRYLERQIIERTAEIMPQLDITGLTVSVARQGRNSPT